MTFLAKNNRLSSSGPYADRITQKELKKRKDTNTTASLVRNSRDSYREIGGKEGMSGLLAKMETKIEELKSAEPEK